MSANNDVGIWVRRLPARKAGQTWEATRWARSIAALGVQGAVLVTNAGHKPHHLSQHTPAALVDAVEALAAEGLWAELMVWPVAKLQAVEELEADQAKIVAAFKARGVPVPPVQLDAEGRYDSTGWGPGGAVLALPLAHALHRAGYRRASVTVIPPLRGPRPQDRALLEALAEVFGASNVEVVPQGYSKDDPRVEWDNAALFRPGVMQRHVLDTFGPLASRLGVGLRMGGIVAFQNHPGDHPDGLEALRVAHDTAHGLGVRRWCYWDQQILASYGRTFLAEASARGAAQAKEPHPDSAPAPQAAPVSADFGSDQVRELQRLLRDAGFVVGPVDGVVGPRTRAAALAYAKEVQRLRPLLEALVPGAL